MNHNFKELLLWIGAQKVMDTREIKKYFLEKTGINKWTFRSWWLYPEISIRKEHELAIIEFFNAEYQLLKLNKNFTADSLYSSAKASNEIAGKFGMKKQPA